MRPQTRWESFVFWLNGPRRLFWALFDPAHPCCHMYPNKDFCNVMRSSHDAMVTNHRYAWRREG